MGFARDLLASLAIRRATVLETIYNVGVRLVVLQIV